MDRLSEDQANMEEKEMCALITKYVHQIRTATRRKKMRKFTSDELLLISRVLNSLLERKLSADSAARDVIALPDEGNQEIESILSEIIERRDRGVF